MGVVYVNWSSYMYATCSCECGLLLLVIIIYAVIYTPPPTFRVLGSSKFFIIYEPHIIILRTSDDANKTIFLLFPIPLDLMSGSIWTLAKCIPSIFANDPPKIGLDYYLLTLKLYWPKKIIKSTCDEKNIHCTK